MTLAQWGEQYRTYKDRADKVTSMIRERAREACERAGLSGELLGIHPYNAMLAYQSGKPWKGIDYTQVRLCLYLLEKQWEPQRILEQWHVKTWQRITY